MEWLTNYALCCILRVEFGEIFTARSTCCVVLKSHSVKGHWCEARKALTKEELSRVKTGKCCLFQSVV